MKLQNLFRKSIVEDHAVRKEFSYSKNEVNLKFTLRVDVNDQLKDFKELMEKAINDIDEQLSK